MASFSFFIGFSILDPYVYFSILDSEVQLHGKRVWWNSNWIWKLSIPWSRSFCGTSCFHFQYIFDDCIFQKQQDSQQSFVAKLFQENQENLAITLWKQTLLQFFIPFSSSVMIDYYLWLNQKSRFSNLILILSWSRSQLMHYSENPILFISWLENQKSIYSCDWCIFWEFLWNKTQALAYLLCFLLVIGWDFLNLRLKTFLCRARVGLDISLEKLVEIHPIEGNRILIF